MALPILCYHKVAPAAEAGRRLNVEPEVLASHIRWFRQRGFRFLCAGDLAGRLPDRSVCLTFDDAYRSTLTHGLEALARNGAAASVYAVPGLVADAESTGRAPRSDWDGDQSDELADFGLLRRAAELGVEIGNHTDRHADLSALDDGRAAAQIAEADRRLREWGFEPRSLAAPYGRLPARSVPIPYPVVLGLGRRCARETDDRTRLPRIVVAYGDRLPKLLYRIYVRPALPTFRRRSHYVA
ncbi:MAG: polysaccharide deacetylase family protein [Fimbriimonadaceae bacterium]